MEIYPRAIHLVELISTPDNAIVIKASSDGTPIWWEKMQITEQVFQQALESTYKAGVESGVESERNRIAKLISNTAFDAQSGLTPGLLSKAVMVVSKRIFGELNV